MAASSLVAGMDIRYNVRRVSESQSEASSITTDLSEDELARLGITDPLELKSERFKVDRKKLEEMIQSEYASAFFESLAKETTTIIHWPSHLKIDAKSKKDVHVKILGKLERIHSAKERILEKLDARGSRVTMKMDISYNDHSSIIGTGGNNIKRIMDETSTHIHFPDSNKDPKESKEFARRTNTPYNHNQYPNSHIEGIHNSINKFPPKSNQVSLNGTLEGVERARAAVRKTSPLAISFETPVSDNQKPSFALDPYVDKVKSTFDVKVVSKSTRQKLHSTTVMVKGTEKEADNAKQATVLLINYLCDTLANQTKVCLQMEISIQHHDSIKGPDGSNLRHIMEETNTTIIFPDCKDGNTPQAKKTHVTIKGCIEGVYLARQQLIGNLIITLSFDYSEFTFNSQQIENLNAKYGVIISWREKSKQTGKSISIKGKEKFIDKIYEARHELLKLTTPLIKAEIPLHYYSKMDINRDFGFRQTLALNRPESPMINHLGPLGLSHLGSQFEALQNAFSSNNGGMPNWQSESPRIPSFYSNLFKPRANTSQRNSISPITSGYNSGHNSFNSGHNSFTSSSSLDVQTSLFQKSQNVFSDRNATLLDTGAAFDEEKTPTLQDVKNSFTFDHQKKLEGFRAMKQTLGSEAIRTPNSNWSGLGLSQTSPFAIETVRKTGNWDRNEASPTASPFDLVQTSGLVDAVSSDMLLGHHEDLPALLVSLGLDHYINTFHVNEIDLELFSTLTPENLTTLGIQAFGARKKLLMAIHQLNASKLSMNRSTRFSGSAAPGAERRISGDWQS